MVVLIKQKPLTLSVIIPVFNEEDYLETCLNSIGQQTIMPLEVIIVDNNSTDESVSIAKQFDFVRVISEKRQHQSYAQAKGFNMAKGDVIGRIDADAILPTNWVENVTKHFAENTTIVALTGDGSPYDMSLYKTSKLVFEVFFSISRRIAGHNLMWGANCALRKDSWQKIKHKVSMGQDIWEDYDLSFCLSKVGRIDYLNSIDVSVSYRAINKPFITQLSYQLRAVKTITLHKGNIIGILFLFIWSMMLFAYPIILIERYVMRPLFGQYRNFRVS